MKLILTFFFIFIGIFANAMNITGIVLSDNDSTEVVGATCKLMSEGHIITISNTGNNGEFELATDLKTKLEVEITMVGYNPTEILIEEGSGNVDLGTIYLNEGVALQEVVVTGQSMVNANGRTIVYPTQADIKASSTAISLFQKLPLAGLESNPINRTLTVDGGRPMILINGIPSTIEDIQGLQAKDITKIEFSRVTPARYADQGYSGFLNITLKERTDGGTVYLWGRSALNTAFMDGNFNFSYHQGPSQFTIGYSPSWRNYHDVFDNTWESLIAPDFKVDLEDHDNNPFNYHYHNLRFKYDFTPNSKTLFSATLRAMPNYNTSKSYGNVKDSELGEYSYINKTTNDGFNPSLDLFFRYDFNDNNSLEIEEVGTINHSKYRYNSIYDFGNYDEDYSMDANSNRSSLISEISYVHNFNDKSSLSVGYQNTYSYSKNKYLSSDYTPILKENNNYVYAKYGQTIGKVYFSLSTGAKLFWIENDLNKRHFIRNLSSIYLSWNISNLWSIVGNFTYNPGIPSLTSLTDYPQQKTPYLIVNGNPDLKVSETMRYQIMPSFQYKKFYASLLLGYRTVKNQVIDETYYIGEGLFLQQSNNIKKGLSTGGDLNLKISDVAGFGANISIGFYHYASKGLNWRHHLNAFDANFTLWWSKGPFTISYWRKIPGKYLNGYYEGRDENGDALSIEYKPNKHWSIEAGWWYMFEKKGTKYPMWSYSEVNPFYRERYIKNNGNMIVISVSYNTDFGSIFRTGKRSLNNSDNSSSLFTM
ncbi:MAG: outer membrane beta-barrel protein [Muribaculaceae bacterium]|nr:outer membrane beta-barrel protein [Muribaculaceae bacterium]